ncbi:MAG: ATP-dependent RecD-like DNA helicase, partial [Oscillospiraceae bacterium]
MAERLEGTVEHVVFQNSETGYAVVEVLVDEEYFTAVGPLAGICEGEEISAEGEFVNHASFGKQFKVTNCEYRLPETASSIEKYLAAGTLPGVGAVVARRIVDEFGADTFNVISNTPNKLSTIKGLNPSKAMKIHNEFNRIFGIREAVKFLGTMGISSAVAIEVYKHYGELTAQLISENPFLLCA